MTLDDTQKFLSKLEHKIWEVKIRFYISAYFRDQRSADFNLRQSQDGAMPENTGANAK